MPEPESVPKPQQPFNQEIYDQGAERALDANEADRILNSQDFQRHLDEAGRLIGRGAPGDPSQYRKPKKPEQLYHAAGDSDPF